MASWGSNSGKPLAQQKSVGEETRTLKSQKHGCWLLNEVAAEIKH
jgi:hypothetical protein